MRVIITVLAFVLLTFQWSTANQLEFGDSTRISLITCEPGEELYAKFGHTAIRVRDLQGRDLVYNYGIFNFRTENFYLKFLLGQTDYLLGVSPTDYFLAEYRERNSTVWEQELNLTNEEKRRLINSLNVNYLPENRTYRYNFAFDNCATRPRDKIQEALEGSLIIEPAFESETYRELVNSFLGDSPWEELGINIVFGAEADQVARKYAYQFLPVYLMNSLHNAKVSSYAERKQKYLVMSNKTLVAASAKTIEKQSFLTHPLTVFLIWLIAGAILTVAKERRSRYNKIFDSLLYFVTGLAGLLIFILTFFSEHPLVGYNFNLLWLNPLNLIASVFIWFRSRKKWLLFYHAFEILLILIYIVLLATFVQATSWYIAPLIALMLIRMFRRMRNLVHSLTVPTPKGFKWLK